MILHLDKSTTQLQISKDIGLFVTELVEFLYPLEHKKLIIPDNNEFALSIQGQQFLAEIWPIVEKTNAEILKGFTSIEREQLESFLARLQKIVPILHKLYNFF